MRNILLFCLLISFISCEKNDTEDLLPDVPVDVYVNLNLPQFINLQAASGWVTTYDVLKVFLFKILVLVAHLSKHLNLLAQITIVILQ